MAENRDDIKCHNTLGTLDNIVDWQNYRQRICHKQHKPARSTPCFTNNWNFMRAVKHTICGSTRLPNQPVTSDETMIVKPVKLVKPRAARLREA